MIIKYWLNLLNIIFSVNLTVNGLFNVYGQLLVLFIKDWFNVISEYIKLLVIV